MVDFVEFQIAFQLSHFRLTTTMVKDVRPRHGYLTEWPPQEQEDGSGSVKEKSLVEPKSSFGSIT